jgi:hypothetical protein
MMKVVGDRFITGKESEMVSIEISVHEVGY